MRQVWLLPAVALVLTGCSAEPRAELRGDVEAITLAANDGDADGVREGVEELLSTIRRQVVENDLSREEGEALRALALRIAENAGLLDPEPSPTEVPSPTEEPSPTPEPSPTEVPSPTPEPSPSEAPPPVEESPVEEPSPILEISPASSQSSPSPAAAQSGSQPSPAPTSSPAA